ncbi:histidine phosphatase family protein [Paracoccus sp. (in: a-proteobacteria)]|uniref:histidine phosphatase family protein n=1 Tax=Paracoccus sp. TaxID=267 RepID=UPI0035ADB2DD
MDLPDLYLIRHGQTRWNAEGRLQGRLDSPLTQLGRAQATALRPLVGGVRAARLCSPLGRAVETAQILFGRDFDTDPRLAEIDVGAFTGRLLAELRRDIPEAFAGRPHEWYDRAPSGEGLPGLQARLSAVLADLPGPAILVTHGMALAMLCALATGKPLADVHPACQTQGALHVIRAGHHDILPAVEVATGQRRRGTLEGSPAGG